MAFNHGSKVAGQEPPWGSINNAQLPRPAFADMGDLAQKSTWRYPHHWVQGGSNLAENGTFTTGTMHLHRGGLNAAWAAAQGARTGIPASPAITTHLQAHRQALGLAESAGKGQEDTILIEGREALLPFGDKMVVDREAGVVRNVPVLGFDSPTRNRTYAIEAMRLAVPLFEGIPFYGDRGKHEKWDEAPSPFDLIGCLENPHFVEGEQKIRADIRPVKQMAEWFMGLAEDMPMVVGPSPVMRGITSLDRGTGKEVVVKIVEARRVDLVSRPSTVSGLHESADPTGTTGEEEEMDYSKLTQEELARERPDLVKLIESAATVSQGEADKLTKLEAQVKTLTESVAAKAKEADDLNAEKAIVERKGLAAKLLTESALPKEAVSDQFREMVEAAADEDAMKKLITDRQTLVEGVRRSPTSYERTIVEGQGDEQVVDLKDDAQLVEVITGSE